MLLLEELNRQDQVEFLKVSALIKATTADLTNQKDVEILNKLLEQLRTSILITDNRIVDNKGQPIQNIDEYVKSNLNKIGKEIKVSAGKSIRSKEGINNVDMRELFKQVSNNGGRNPKV